MIFDVFHSLGRIDTVLPPLVDEQVFRHAAAQARLAEDLGFETLWVAESHFSSEVQKSHREPVIPHYRGEVGLNNDSPQLAQWLFAQTWRIGFGTAIFNIVGGNGGPIGAADRIRSLAFLNGLSERPRRLEIGVAAGRFPYINKPYGIAPRNAEEEALWSAYKRLIFIEALEIFLRLSRGETLSSEDLTTHAVTRGLYPNDQAWEAALNALRAQGINAETEVPYRQRWSFEPLKLVPALSATAASYLRFVLGSADPLARDLALRYADLDIFNLSFTPPQAIEGIHADMQQRYREAGRRWGRERLPRTVLVFIDRDPRKARERASEALDTYIEAMRGTVGTPPKEVLLQRALIGDAAMIKDQLSPGAAHGFHPNDRLMLWFEFNQTDLEAITAQMRYFAEAVAPAFSSPIHG